MILKKVCALKFGQRALKLMEKLQLSLAGFESISSRLFRQH